MTRPTDRPVDLRTEVAGLPLRNPVMTASGCAGTGRELVPFLDVEALGAFTTRSISLDPHAGSPGRRATETTAGVLSAVGGQNPGLQSFLATELPWLAQHKTRVVVSVGGSTASEYAELARRLGASPGVAALEVNLSWANRDARDRPFAAEPYHAAKVVAAVRRELPGSIPVLAKLGADHGVLVDAAHAVVASGADGLVLTNPPPGLAVDPVTLRPSLGPALGGLSGPAIHALAVAAVWRVHEALPDVPLVGVGGVRSGYDALELLAAGAAAVQVGSITFRDPTAPARVLGELRHELADRDISCVPDVVGRAHRPEGEPL